MENKNNSGAIFKNDKKGNDKAPDYKGSITVNGLEMNIALWVREAKNGTKYFSVKLSDKYKMHENSPKNEIKSNDEPNDLPWEI